MAENIGATEIHPGVTVDPSVVRGKSVIAGTRVPVSSSVGHLAAGDTFETVCDEYDLTPEHAQAALGSAAAR